MTSAAPLRVGGLALSVLGAGALLNDGHAADVPRIRTLNFMA